MSKSRVVRTCLICTENNPPAAGSCRICGADISGVAPGRVALPADRARPLLGPPERIVLGSGAGVIIGMLLQPHNAFLGIIRALVFQVPFSGGDGMDQLLHPFTLPSFTLITMCGIAVGGLVALAALNDGSLLQGFGVMPTRLRPCPCCAEMIQSQARICRYCNHSVKRGGSERFSYELAASRSR